ncbi:hypothetical protein ACSWZG_007176, partial [Pseudomonas aeruginosa]
GKGIEEIGVAPAFAYWASTTRGWCFWCLRKPLSRHAERRSLLARTLLPATCAWAMISVLTASAFGACPLCSPPFGGTRYKATI